MADKEERILITQWNVKDNTCPVPINSQCYTTKSCDDCKAGISKQEAIEVMAKAIYKEMWIESECKNKNTLGFSICKDYAEIALNALLGVKK